MSGEPGRGGEMLPGSWRPHALCAGVSVLFTQRSGGVSAGPFRALNLSERIGDDPAAVAANRDRLLRAVRPGADRLAWMRQVHGADVVYVARSPEAPAPRPAQVEIGEADAAVTDVPGAALGVLVADCAPVLVADPQAGIVGAAHAGRAGLAARVVPELIGAMTARGADTGRMHAIIGPCICGRCYEVPASMRAEVESAAPGSACRTRTGTPGIDIRAGIRGQLATLGVATVTDDARCTAESPELYSHRRDGKTGRFAGLIWLAP